ncbi:reductive dehalogenase [Luteithermobacter gelatinilyticus]|uniref:reductive dehalogenase n=1 Tax=Luteithermobacter gelatinilyticus TaxID=2582913 RepID=UPI0011072367|nr:reductive dehalogenase [Luteithermobacter gelatinilyticus]
MRFFSYKDRPVHLGPYPLERLKRTSGLPDLSAVPPMVPVSFVRQEDPLSLVNAMRDYQAMMDAIRDGLVKKERAVIPDDLEERAAHLKAFGYYCDASQVGICRLTPDMFLEEPLVNPGVDKLAEDLKTRQTETLASGIDVVMAELRETMEAPPRDISHHTHALVFLYEYPRDPAPNEPGTAWIREAQPQRAALRGAETAIVLSNYIRLLGWEARGHTGSASDVDLNKLVIAAGLGDVVHSPDGPCIENPYLGRRFGIAAVTTTLDISPDRPLAPRNMWNRWHSHGPAWWVGKGFAKNAFNREAFARRRFADGQHPFEKINRVETPTTFIDEARVPRVPKRTDMFARALFGDMGKTLQEKAKNGNYVRKSPISFAARRALAAFVLLQDGPRAETISETARSPEQNSLNLKAALYFLGADAVGLSRCPDWVYYSHNALGEPITPYHQNAISVIIDQGHETMDGASGDDWIACSQSMRAYLRFSLLGGVIANQIRALGYSARVHSVMDGEVLQPPLLLLSGLGEVSRIGEVILNPFLGPRLKSGVITTDMPLKHDKPIDFGLQNFCNNCNKCARECPSGAITAGPKKMFNGYEIWKSDSQRCTQYRVGQPNGAMCGRCMKTCPWNLEGLFAEAPFRWLASHVPVLAKTLARLDDTLGRGRLNPVKKWWWDLEMEDEGPYAPSRHEVNKRDLQPDLDLKFEDQTLAVYPANLAPPPWPYTFPMNREKGIQAYRDLLSPETYRDRLRHGKVDGLAHEYKLPPGPPPVLRVKVAKVKRETADIISYDLTSLNGASLPAFEAGAHVDVVVAPEFIRSYSLAGDPADRSKYRIAVLREESGTGGSQLLHRIFTEGRKVFITRPVNHFPLQEDAQKSLLMAGGIGITPLMAMAYRLHALGAAFTLHYSCASRQSAAFLSDLATVPWADRVHLHFSDEGSRADLDKLLEGYEEGFHLYTCGPDRYMNAVLDTASALGWPEDALHKEYFSVPETGDYVNHRFTVRLVRSGRDIPVPAEKRITDVLAEQGIHVPMKCSDGICGVCKCGLVSGEVEHRDFVLSAKERATHIILCSSRAKQEGGVIEIDL